MIKDLSFYKKSTPIKYIFTLNCESFEVPGYEIKIVESPKFSDGSRAPAGMEINTIVNFLIDSDPLILKRTVKFPQHAAVTCRKEKYSFSCCGVSSWGSFVVGGGLFWC